MTSYGTNKTPQTTGFASSTIYWKITGPVLAVVALLGFALNAFGAGAFIPSFLEFDITHNIVHALLAGIAFYFGFASSPTIAKSMAKIVGVVYLLLGVVGFLSATVFGIGTVLGLHLELGENLIHIVLGGWAAYTGFAE